MTTFERLLQPVMPILERIEQKRHRHGLERLTWLDFVRILVYYFTVRPGSLRSLEVALATADPALHLPKAKRSTLSDAFWRFPARLLRQAWQEALHHLQLPSIPELELIGTAHIVDGSEFPVIGGIYWHPVQDLIPHVKLHLALHANQMAPVDFLLTHDKGNERDALRRLLKAEVLYVLDRGYFSFALCRDILRARADFVMHIYNNTRPTTVLEPLPVTLPEALHDLYEDLQDRKVTFGHPAVADRALHLITFRLGPTHYALLTNRFDLTTYQIILLYAYRWQIELIFRNLKHLLPGLQPITASSNGLANYFAAMFLTTLLHMSLRADTLQQGGKRPPSSPAQEPSLAPKASPSRQPQRPSAWGPAARFLAGIAKQLTLFWRITKHWLETLACVLHWHFDRNVIDLLNKYALCT